MLSDYHPFLDYKYIWVCRRDRNSCLFCRRTMKTLYFTLQCNTICKSIIVTNQARVAWFICKWWYADRPLCSLTDMLQPAVDSTLTEYLKSRKLVRQEVWIICDGDFWLQSCLMIAGDLLIPKYFLPAACVLERSDIHLLYSLFSQCRQSGEW